MPDSKPATAPSKRLFTEEEAAAYLSYSRSFLRKARCNGQLENHSSAPAYIVIGKKSIRYRREDLDAWSQSKYPELAFGAASEAAIDVVETRFLKEEEAAHYLAFSCSFLRKARSRGCLRNGASGPPYVVTGARGIRYSKKDLDAWIDLHPLRLSCVMLAEEIERGEREVFLACG